MNWTFFLRFLISCFLLIFFSAAYCLFQNRSNKRLSANSSYHAWFPYFLLLLFPFLPSGLLLSFPSSSTGVARIAHAVAGEESASLGASNGFQDFYQSPSLSPLQLFCICLGLLWILGILCSLFLWAAGRYRIFRTAASGCRIQEKHPSELYEVCQHCCRILGIQKTARIYVSCRIRAVLSWGIFRPSILIPEDMELFFSREELEYIFLHELLHYQKRDTVMNQAVCLFRCIYWFHPFVRHCLNRIQLSRETSCDERVLTIISNSQKRIYGQTILHFAEYMGRPRTACVLQFGSQKQALKHRLLKIIGYQKPACHLQRKSRVYLVLLTTVVFCMFPVLSASASGNADFSYGEGNYKEWDAAAYFSDLQGAFVLYDDQENTFLFSDKADCMKRFSPASTFKIYSALFALDEGFISPQQSVRTWNGETYAYDSWMQDQALDSAMKNSVNWYFQSLDEQTGLTRLQKAYQNIHYGNADLSGGTTSSYWMDSSLKISPYEQALLLSKLWKNEWQYADADVSAVKQSLLLSESKGRKLYGKTGTQSDRNGRITQGWFVGCVEDGNKKYTVSLHIEGNDTASGSKAADTALSILKDLSLYE